MGTRGSEEGTDRDLGGFLTGSASTAASVGFCFKPKSPSWRSVRGPFCSFGFFEGDAADEERAATARAFLVLRSDSALIRADRVATNTRPTAASKTLVKNSGAHIKKSRYSYKHLESNRKKECRKEAKLRAVLRETWVRVKLLMRLSSLRKIEEKH